MFDMIVAQRFVCEMFQLGHAVYAARKPMKDAGGSAPHLAAGQGESALLSTTHAL